MQLAAGLIKLYGQRDTVLAHEDTLRLQWAALYNLNDTILELQQRVAVADAVHADLDVDDILKTALSGSEADVALEVCSHYVYSARLQDSAAGLS